MTACGRLRNDRRGMVAIEFALVFPMLLMLTVGIIEFALMMLMDASLEIAIREASRVGSLTALLPDATAREAKVKDTVNAFVSRWVPGTNTITVDLRIYDNMANIGKPTWVDGNGNNICDPGEGTCPPQGVKVVPGAGSAGALVLYQVTVIRPGFTGILKLAGIGDLTFRRCAIVVNE